MSNWRGKHGPLLIAEIGGNHEGDFEYAKELTQLAIEADVDYIKYQIYTGDSLVSHVENPVRNKHFKKFELSQEQYIELAKMCQAGGAKFMASVWNPEFFNWIDQYMDVYKIGSGDMTAYPVLKATAQKKKPIILSTGLSSLEDVKGAVAYLQSCDELYSDPEYISILQCTSMYPIPYTESHLNVMHTYANEFNLPIGYSDHTEGSYALEIAVAMGAQILEFHFTDTRENKSFRDHKVSLTRDEVLDLQIKLKHINELKGSAVKVPLEVEGEHPITFRRACYFNQDMRAGEIVSEVNLTTLRPNHGIDAREYDQLIGKTLKTTVQKGAKLDWTMFE